MGIKRGENQHQSISCIRSIQCYFSRSEMNYLCAVLVLAFAAGSVHSTFCSNSGYYEPELKQEFVKQCNSHFPISFGSLPLIRAITLPLLDTLTKVTGVSLNLLDASVSIDNFHAHATININLACDSFPNTAIVIDINADLNTYLEDGCPLLGFSGLSVTLQISGTTLNPNKALIDEVLKSVTTTVTEVVNTILDKVLLTINCLAKSFTSVHIIGDQPCHYEISKAEIEEDLLKGTCCLHTEEGSECSENVDVALSDGIFSAVKLTNNILSTILKSVIGSAKYLVKVPDSITGDLAINYGSPIYLRATYTGVDACSFVPNGVEATLSVEVEIFAKTDLETPIISVTTKIYLTGGIYYKQGYWGVQLQASPSLDLDLEVEDDTCGCQDSILTWVKDYISCHLNGIIDTLNSKLQLCLQVPNPGGIPPTNTEVIPGQDYCEFRYL